MRLFRSLVPRSLLHLAARRVAPYRAWRKVARALVRRLRPFAETDDEEFLRDLRVDVDETLGFGVGTGVGGGGEESLLQLLSRHLPRGAVVFDVGANRGTYARAVTRLLKPEVVYAFEPSPVAFEALVTAVSGDEAIRPVALALGASAGKAVLYSDRPGSGLASLHRRQLDYLDIAMEREEEVTVARLDDFCREEGVERIDLLKLDVEGHELFVLDGAAETLSRGAVHAVQFEFGGCNIDSRTFFKDLFYRLRDGYRVFRVLPGGLLPVDRYRESDERFVTTNYVALSRDELPALAERGPIAW